VVGAIDTIGNFAGGAIGGDGESQVMPFVQSVERSTVYVMQLEG
jgi:hypothetical protein